MTVRRRFTHICLPTTAAILFALGTLGEAASRRAPQHQSQAPHHQNQTPHHQNKAPQHQNQTPGTTKGATPGTASHKKKATKSTAGKKASAKHGKAKNNLGSALHELREAHSLLARARHDHGGYRRRAMEEVRRAMHDLEQRHRQQAAKQQSTGHMKGAKGQSQSATASQKAPHAKTQQATGSHTQDANSLLQESMSRLQAAQQHLPERGDEVARAQGHIGHAINDVESALQAGPTTRVGKR